MPTVSDVLQAQRSAKPIAAARVALLAGAGGSLGSAVLEQALAVGGFSQVRVLSRTPVAAAMRGFVALPLESPEQARPAADTAFIVFDRERHANGREDAFLRPDPRELLPLAVRLHEAGVKRLLVVLPHAPALLPHALKLGLASLDEQAIAALGFEQVVLVRSAQAAAGASGPARALARLARTVLAQLHWMIPAQEQPVRAAVVAGFVARLARELPAAAAGTRVVPPDALWQASQSPSLDDAVRAWLFPLA